MKKNSIRVIAILILVALMSAFITRDEQAHGINVGQKLVINFDMINERIIVHYDTRDNLRIILHLENGNLDKELKKIGNSYHVDVDESIINSIKSIQLTSNSETIYHGDLPECALTYLHNERIIRLTETKGIELSYSIYTLYSQNVIKKSQVINGESFEITQINPGNRIFVSVTKDNLLYLNFSYYIPLIHADLHNNSIKILNNKGMAISRLLVFMKTGEEIELLNPSINSWIGINGKLTIQDVIKVYYVNGDVDVLTVGLPIIRVDKNLSLVVRLLNMNKSKILISNTTGILDYKVENNDKGVILKDIENKNLPQRITAYTREGHIVSTSVLQTPSITEGFIDIKNTLLQLIVGNLVELGIFRGYEGNRFNPEVLITRGEFISAVINILRKSIDTNNIVLSFKDVQQGHWFYGSVVKARAIGLIHDGEFFRPTEEISLEEAIGYLSKIYHFIAQQEDNKALLEIVGYETDNLHSAIGYSSNNTGNSITRGEAAVLIYNLINILSLIEK